MKNTLAARLHDPTLLLAIAFTAALAVYEWLALPFQSHDFVEVYRPLQGLVIQTVSYLVIPALFWVSFNGKVLTRIAAYLLFLAVILTEYGYCFAMGRFSIVQDYILGFQAVDLRLIRNAMMAYFLQRWEGLAPLVVYALLLWLTYRRQRFGIGALALTLIPVVLFYTAVQPFSRGTFPTVSYSAGFRSLVFTSIRFVNTYHGPREAVADQASQKPLNNVVFVVDESVRGDHLSLNGYERDTTPYLRELEQSGRLYNWGIAASGATSSLNANQMLLTGIYRLPDIKQDTLRKPSIMQYAKAMGYNTYYLDVQMDTPWLLGKRDLQYVDHLLGANQFSQGKPASEFDFSAAQYLHEILSQSGGNFVWINKLGVHFPYAGVLPDDKYLWQPAEKDLIYNGARSVELTNTYDSVLAYNLDTFFKLLLGADGLKNTVIVYTSDHGQTLSENGESWPHSGNTRNEALTPLLIITDQPLQGVDTGFKASHANLFATLLDLMRFPEDQRAYPYAPSLLKARAGDPNLRFYLFGTIDSSIGSEIIDFDR